MTAALDKVLLALEEVLPEAIGREYADILWLAGWLLRHLPVAARDTQPAAADATVPIADGLPQPAESPAESAIETPLAIESPPEVCLDRWVNVYAQGPAAVSSRRRSGRSFRAPLAEALPARLALVRSLRPLMRRVASRTAWQLAEEETVQRIAEGDIWMPLMRPAPERWFDATLVVDGSVSMSIWRDTARELRDLLIWSGAFRELRALRWLADGEQLTLENERGRPAAIARGQSGRPHLILVLSDCVSRAWWTGAAFAELRRWSRFATIGLLQALPEPLWSRTALGRTRRVRLSSRFTAAPNAAFAATALDDWEQGELPAGLRLPIAVLEPASLGALAHLVAGPTGNGTAGVVIDAGHSHATPDAVRSSLSAVERVNQFKQSASPLAQRLAGLIAVSPVVSLQVIRHIRNAMLPAARQIHEAEFLLGGLLHVKPNTSDDLVRDNDTAFGFFEGVADLLLDSVPAPAWIDVLSRVSECLERRLGELGGFRAFLEDPSAPVEQQEVSEHPFVQLAAPRLQRLGGAYASGLRIVRTKPVKPEVVAPSSQASAAQPSDQPEPQTPVESPATPLEPPIVATADPATAEQTVTTASTANADESVFDVTLDATAAPDGINESTTTPAAPGGSDPATSVPEGTGDSGVVLPDEFELSLDPDGQSGISLTPPQDSGISLELPLDPQGSAFELSLDDSLETSADSGIELNLDDEFQLTPADEGGSSSQVISLDDEADAGDVFELALDDDLPPVDEDDEGSQVIALDDSDDEDRTQIASRDVNAAIQEAQAFVREGQFDEARQLIRRLPALPELEKARREWDRQIDESEDAWREATRQNKQLERAIQRATGDAGYLDQVASQGRLNRENAREWNGALQAIARQLGITVGESQRTGSKSPARSRPSSRDRQQQATTSNASVTVESWSGAAKVPDCAFGIAGLPKSGKTIWFATCFQLLSQGRGPTAVKLTPQVADPKWDEWARTVLQPNRRPETDEQDSPQVMRLQLSGRRRWTEFWRSVAATIEVRDLSSGLDAADVQQTPTSHGILYFIDASRTGLRNDEVVEPLIDIGTRLRKSFGSTANSKLPVPIAICLTKCDLLLAEQLRLVGADGLGGNLQSLWDEMHSPASANMVRVERRGRLARQLVRSWPEVEAACEKLFSRFQVFPMSAHGMAGDGTQAGTMAASLGILEPLLWLLHVNGYPALD